MEQQEMVRQLEVAWRHFYTTATFDKKYLVNAKLHPMIIPHSMECAVAQITTMVAGERVKEIKYPMDWWQAFKERWFPKFLLKRFPVDYRIWKIDFLYPEIEWRKQLHPQIAIYDNKRSRGYPSFEDAPQEYKDLEED